MAPKKRSRSSISKKQPSAVIHLPASAVQELAAAGRENNEDREKLNKVKNILLNLT